MSTALYDLDPGGQWPEVVRTVRPVGVLEMMDQDQPDEKILVVPTRNPRFDRIRTVEDVFPHSLREIEHFFSIYKELEEKRTDMRGWRSTQNARQVITSARKRYAALR